ncbi:hypothetical protein IW140_005696 [Coemansia sp. RSA 1813]|nr:hypothetical protein EV178_001094 [Coemansia sp. RSA 1646]KAJ1768276.1 hypothetical protein LPJ74_004941 [Coemansia sp. RSA 1843]KAJ2210523.1 hypothetical protein EV179_006181 [Coemansia sp. RSA 487]KAJ2564550.1 hypothetical protein IW140_005696 [Coemansia sp. RSA 1813]
MSSPSNSVLEDIISGIFSDDGQTQKQYLSIVGLLYQTGIMFAIGAGAFLVFILLRPQNTRVYARRYKALAKDERRPPKIGRGIFAWVPAIWNANEKYLMDTVDMDSVYFLRFVKLNIWLLLIYTVLGMCVTVPVNYSNGNNENVTSNLNKFALLWITLYHITTLKVFWLHAIGAYVFTAIFFYFIWREYKVFERDRQNYFSSPAYLRKLQSRTIMVTRVPADMQTNSQLQARFTEYSPSYPPTQVSIARKIGELQELIDKHEKMVRKLEKVLCKYLAGDYTNKPRPQMKFNGAMVDSIEHYTQEIEGLEELISRARQESETFTPTSVAFLSYPTPQIAHFAKRSMHRTKPMIATLAPHPKEVIWSNAQLPKSKRIKRQWLARLLSVVFCFVAFWPVAGLTFIADAANIQVLWPDTTNFFSKHDMLTTIWQSTFSPLILVLYYIAMPHVFRAISRYQGISTHTGVERSVLKKMYVFYFLSNIGVFTLVGVIVRTVFKRKTQEITVGIFFHDFVQSLNMKAQFWTAYVALRGLNAMVELAQPLSLLLIFFKRYTRNLTPRELRDLTRPPEFDSSPVYSLYLWVFTISMFYSMYSPIVLPFALLAFVMAYWAYKYVLMYVYQTKYDTAGEMWRCAINRMVVSMVFFQVYLCGCLRARISEFVDRPQEIHASLPIVYIVIPLPVITTAVGIYLHLRLKRRVDYTRESVETESFEMQKHSSADGPDETIGDRFLHPIFSQPLTTPTIDKRVRHLLPKVYRGRTSIIGTSKAAAIGEAGGSYGEHRFAGSIANASTVYGSDTMDLESVMDERDRHDFDGTATPDPFARKRQPGGLARSYSVESNISGATDTMEMKTIGRQYTKDSSGSQTNLLSHAHMRSPANRSDASIDDVEETMMMASMSNAALGRNNAGAAPSGYGHALSAPGRGNMYGAQPSRNIQGQVAMLTQQGQQIPAPRQMGGYGGGGGGITFADDGGYDLDDIIDNGGGRMDSTPRYHANNGDDWARGNEQDRMRMTPEPYAHYGGGSAFNPGSGPRTANMGAATFNRQPQQQLDDQMQPSRYGASSPAGTYGRQQQQQRNIPRWE